MTTIPDLLLLRLDALGLDIEKVRVAVESAQKRGRFLEYARGHITPCKRHLRTVEHRLSALLTAMEDDPRIATLIGDATANLENELCQTPEIVAGLIQSVQRTVDCLGAAMATTVSLDDRSMALQASLNRRCGELRTDLQKLKEKVEADAQADRRKQWLKYQKLLEDVARPVFVEYVDFLGGLTVRDTGLDDRVCEMTDALLTRFKGVTQRSLPLPARQAALGNALDSVVLLGFPEWSIWGIPLVGHEVGLAYAKDQNDRDLVALIRKFVPEVPSGAPSEESVHRTEEYVQQLLADAFASYTLGLSYACAALLLRLSPRHDDPYEPSRPRDIDRARVIMMTLKAGGQTAPAAGGSFSDAVGRLQQIWEAAVRAQAGPARADAAVEEAQGPPPHKDWLDDFTREAVEHFRSLITIPPYDNERWKASSTWHEALRDKRAGPGWIVVEDAVPDALTAAWRLRLVEGADPVPLAADLTQRWSEGRKGA